MSNLLQTSNWINYKNIIQIKTKNWNLIYFILTLIYEYNYIILNNLIYLLKRNNLAINFYQKVYYITLKIVKYISQSSVTY
jgi:hypothetical protein